MSALTLCLLSIALFKAVSRMKYINFKFPKQYFDVWFQDRISLTNINATCESKSSVLCATCAIEHVRDGNEYLILDLIIVEPYSKLDQLTVNIGYLFNDEKSLVPFSLYFRSFYRSLLSNSTLIDTTHFMASEMCRLICVNMWRVLEDQLFWIFCWKIRSRKPSLRVRSR